MSLLSRYLPAATDLTPQQIQDARAVLAQFVQIRHPELGTEPGTPFNDLHLVPLAELFAALDVAVQRFSQDHDLDAINQGKSWLCDVASQFVSNFLPYTSAQRLANGYLRLIFRSDKPYELDRGIKFQFDDFNEPSGAAERSVFYMRLFHPGPAVIKPVGSARTAGANEFVLRRESSNVFVCDVPVQGEMQGQIREGATARVSIAVPEMQAPRALFDFSAGSPATSLIERARRAQLSLYGASTGNRAGVQSLLAYEFPDLLASSPVMTGDTEMTRATVNALGLATPCLDVYVKSNQAALLDKGVIRLTYDEVADQFAGRLQLPAFPVYIEDVRAINAPELNLSLRSGGVEVLGRSLDSRAPRGSAGLSINENLWIAVKMPHSAGGAPLLPVELDVDGVPYQDFEVEYRYDPSVPVIADYFAARSNQLVHTSVLVKAFVPVVFTTFEVVYERAMGSDFNRTLAIDNIYNYVARLGYPNLFQEGAVEHIMRNAGARQVLDIRCDARVYFSLAQRYLTEAAPDPAVDWAGAVAASVPLPVVSMAQGSQLRPTLRDLNAGTPGDSFAAVGKHNIAYLLDKGRIVLREELV
jgi:hypothetical protein